MIWNDDALWMTQIRKDITCLTKREENRSEEEIVFKLQLIETKLSARQRARACNNQTPIILLCTHNL